MLITGGKCISRDDINIAFLHAWFLSEMDKNCRALHGITVSQNVTLIIVSCIRPIFALKI